jgi:hypothetical protein
VGLGADITTGGPAPPVDVTPPSLRLDPLGYEGASLHDVPLALLPQQIAMAVRTRGVVAEDDLPDAMTEQFGIDVPRNRRRLLASFAWSAGGRKYIEHDGRGWRSGTESPQPIEHLGSWTITEIENLVRKLVNSGTREDDLFDGTMAIVWPTGARSPRPIAKAIGSCI